MRLIAPLLLACAILCQASEPAAARWEGTVQIPGREMRVVIDLAQDSQGRWTGSAVVPGFGIKGTPLADIVINESEVAFTIKGALGDPKFKGRLTGSGALTGDYQQAGNTAPFTLQKAGPPQVESPRGSTSVRKELEGTWQGEMDLFGTVKVRLDLVNEAGGTATAKFIFTRNKETPLPLNLVTDEGGILTVESTENGITYEGRFRKEASEITGTFQQGPFEVPLVLRSAAKNASEARP
ncbi:MAG: hypothetical protein LAP39_24975 [Acidobacteriia bacterium]|nr:hypothetical protein [Terriglobia bacterium]